MFIGIHICNLTPSIHSWMPLFDANKSFLVWKHVQVLERNHCLSLPGPVVVLLPVFVAVLATIITEGCVTSRMVAKVNVFSQGEWDAFESPENAR